LNKIFIFLFFIIFQLGFSNSVKIKEIVEVEKEKVYFSDIVDGVYEGTDFFFTYAPPVEFEKKLSIDYLKLKLQPYGIKPVLDEDYILIKRKKEKIEFSKIENLIKDEIKKKLNYPEDDVFIQIEKKDDFFVPFYENINFSLKFPNNKHFLIGKFPVIVEVNNGYKTIKTIDVKVNVEIELPVYVAKENIKKGESLKDKVVKEKRRISSFPNRLILDENELNDIVAKNDISKETIITKNLLQERDIVKKGEEIFVTLKEGDLELEVKFISLESGKKGQIIWVKNPINGEKLKIKILEEKKGEIVDGHFNI
jgi:flagella basal body P-ring formation protein FlgA